MLGARIAALRRETGMSQAELAGKLGVSPSAVGMYEQGRREPSAETLVELSRVFQVTTDYLLTGKPGSRSDAQLIGQVLLNSLSAAERKLAERKPRPFSRQELAVLFAAMLMEP